MAPIPEKCFDWVPRRQDDRCRVTPTTTTVKVFPVIGNLQLGFCRGSISSTLACKFSTGLYACAPPVGCNSRQIWLQASCMALPTLKLQHIWPKQGRKAPSRWAGRRLCCVICQTREDVGRFSMHVGVQIRPRPRIISGFISL